MNKHLSCHDLTCMIEHGCVGVYERLITVWVVSSHAGVLFQEIILSDTLSKSRLTAAAYLRDTQGFASSFAFAKSVILLKYCGVNHSTVLAQGRSSG